ncbi:MAG: hypothetical protein ACOX6S_01455 [Clostridia bacterium]
MLIEEQEFPSDAVFNEYRIQARNWIHENSRKNISSRTGRQSSTSRTRRKSSPTWSRQDSRRANTHHQAGTGDRVPKKDSSTHPGKQTKPVRSDVKSTALNSQALPAPDKAASKKSQAASQPEKRKQTARVPFLLRVLQRIKRK